jgi:F-box and leucine-rich repeat protein GRR1
LLEIDLAGCKGLGDDAVTALITEGQNLRELRLAHCVRITDNAFNNLPSISFESLRILDLTDCNELQDNGIHKIIDAAPRLRNLVLAKCRQITDRGIMAITKLGKNLHYIHLGHCARITDVGVQSLVRLCNRIRYIDLACCTNLTDQSITQLATLPKLKRIGLVKCQNITDVSIYALAKPRNGAIPPDSPSSGAPSALERVHLSYCTNLTLAGINALLNNCPRLAHLSLTGVQAFLRDDLLVFCRDAPPDFNDHQREVFCVFSGPGVNRLRFYLNEQANAEHNGMVPGINPDEADDEMDVDGNNPPQPHHRNSMDPLPSPIPPPPPHRRQSLPVQLHPGTFNHVGTFTPVPLSNLRTLPPLQIPTRPQTGPNGTPGQMSPTNDAPLSVDEGEEFNEFSDNETGPQQENERAQAE